MTAPYWSGDGVTLYLGDCREVDEWLAADVLVTDPPYGIANRSGGPRYNKGVFYTSPNVSVHGDRDTTVSDSALAAWGDRPAVVFGTWKAVRPAGTRNRLIWFKHGTNPGMGPGTPWSPAEEEIYILGGGFHGPRTLNVITTYETRCGPGGLAGRIGHPTPKPVPLMQALIRCCMDGVVADPFAGSGSTLVAAKLEGRQAVGVEMDERYCEIAARRLDQGVLDFGDPA